MKKAVNLLAIGLCVGLSGPVLASDDCIEGVVSGSVNTINLGPDVQSGFVNLKITSVDGGRVYFDDQGVIVGEVVQKVEIPGIGEVPAALDHHMYFGRLIQLHTHADQIIEQIPTSPELCSFAVTERVTSATGTRKLRRLTNDQHDITAAGSVSFCPGANQNSFDLSGTVCINKLF